MKKFIPIATLLGAFAFCCPPTAWAAESPNFEKDILPIFRTRCAECHSGDDAEVGLDLSSRDALLAGSKHGPIVKPGSLRDSRLWQKIHMEIMPAKGAPLTHGEKELVRAWIVGGAGDPALAATWDPGAALPRREKASAPAEAAAEIDRLIDERLSAAGIAQSPPAGELVWLRRAYLDITGRIPSSKQTLEWAEGRALPTQSEAIDQLLENTRYGEQFANVWHNRIVPLNGSQRKYDSLLRSHFAAELNAGKPWDEIVHFLLTIEQENGKEKKPTGFYTSRMQPKHMAADATRIFLGVNLECAECHDHPAARWSQEEYWGTAAFFSTVRTGKGRVWEGKPEEDKKNKDEDKAPPLEPGTIEIPGDVLDGAGEVVRATLLGGEQPQPGENGSWRAPLVAWMVSQENPWFARAFVNHAWQHFFGRGLVDPVDDLDPANPPSHPEILDLLAAEFAASGFDHKHLVRCICNTKAYRRSSTPVEGNANDNLLLSHARVRMLSSEQLYNALVDMGFSKNLGKDEEFTTFFMNPTGTHDAENYHHGLFQVMRLMNNESLHSGGRAASDAFKVEEQQGREKAIEQLYLTIVCRRPTSEEIAAVSSYLDQADDLKTAYGGVVWMLLNSAEFTLNY